MHRVPSKGASAILYSNGFAGATHVIPCSYCPECVARYRKSWASRVELARIEYERDGFMPVFVTLTLAPEFYEFFYGDNPSVDPHAFLQPFRQRFRRLTGRNMAYFLVPELGDALNHTGRLHFHGILFNCFTPKDSLSSLVGILCALWRYGGVDAFPATDLRVTNYATKYITKYKGSLVEGSWPFRVYCSRGLGKRTFLEYALSVGPQDLADNGLLGIIGTRGSISPYLIESLPMSFQIAYRIAKVSLYGEPSVAIGDERFPISRLTDPYVKDRFLTLRPPVIKPACTRLRYRYRALSGKLHELGNSIAQAVGLSTSFDSEYFDTIFAVSQLSLKHPWLLQKQSRPQYVVRRSPCTSHESSRQHRASSFRCIPSSPSPTILSAWLQGLQSTRSPSKLPPTLSSGLRSAIFGPTSGPIYPS